MDAVNGKQIQREWNNMVRREERYLKQNLPIREAQWKKKLDQFVPDQLEETMQKAFAKAFTIVFEKGTGLLEKTYDKEKLEQDYKVREYAASLKNDRKSIREFRRSAGRSQRVNRAISAVEGLGMGALGMGLPDIPVFLGVLLKGIYESSLNYGFSYDTREEQYFILSIIETSLLHGVELEIKNDEVNERIVQSVLPLPDEEEWNSQMNRTSLALADELLYLKFIQGIPIVGIFGGISDVVYQKKITDFAGMKYQRRLLCRYRAEKQL